jgi:hypothetical protein
LFKRRQDEPKKVSGFGEPETYKSKYKIVAWFKNYWYYYKIPVIITGCALILVVWFIVDMATKVDQDVSLYIMSDKPLVSEQYEGLTEAIRPYAADFNGDRRVEVGVRYLNLAQKPTDEVQMAAHQQVMTVFFEKEVSVMLVDEFCYEYMMASGGLAKLEEYGVTGGIDEYRIPIAGTVIEELSPTLPRMGDFYLVFRICPEADAEKPQVKANYEAMAGFMQAMADASQAQS